MKTPVPRSTNSFPNIFTSSSRAYGAFIILVMSITALQTFSDLQRDEMAFNHGQQVKNMLSQFGLAVGTAAALGTQWRASEHLAVLNTRFSSGDAAFTQASSQFGEQFAASHGAQAAQVALATQAQQLDQQAALLSSLDYFGFLAAAALVMAAVMTGAVLAWDNQCRQLD